MPGNNDNHDRQERSSKLVLAVAVFGWINGRARPMPPEQNVLGGEKQARQTIGWVVPPNSMRWMMTVITIRQDETGVANIIKTLATFIYEYSHSGS